MQVLYSTFFIEFASLPILPHPILSHMKTWYKYIIEVLVIVFSILAAFGLEAWWEDKQDGKKLNMLLTVVLSELEENRERLSTTITQHQRIIDAIEQVNLAKTSFENNHRQSIIEFATFNPSNNGIEALTSSGILSEMQDIRLQLSISTILSHYQDINSKEQQAIRFRDLARMKIAEHGISIWSDDVEREVYHDDTVIHNFLTMRWSEENQALRACQALMTQLDKSIDEIKAYLDN